MQDLLNILMKLRDQFHYCLFCGCKVKKIVSNNSNYSDHFWDPSVLNCRYNYAAFIMTISDVLNLHVICCPCTFQYESVEALMSECPGIDEDDH